MSEVIRYGWICWATQLKVRSYLVRHFQLSIVLDPFIPSCKQRSLRALMAETDLVISGSVPLQLFTLADWVPNNLNLYVDIIYCARVCTWLRDEGFLIVNMTKPVRSFDDLCHSQETRCTTSTLSFKPSEPRFYRQVPHFINFENRDSKKIVRLTLCQGTPVDMVLRFETSMDVPSRPPILYLMSHSHDSRLG